MNVDQTTHVLCLFVRDAVTNDTDGSNARVKLRSITLAPGDGVEPPEVGQARLRACVDTLGKSIIEHVQYVQLSPDHEQLAAEVARILEVDQREVQVGLAASIANAVAILDSEFRATVRAKLATQMDLGAGRKLSYLDAVMRSLTSVEQIDAFSEALLSDAPDNEANASLRLALMTARMAAGRDADASAPEPARRRRLGV